MVHPQGPDTRPGLNRWQLVCRAKQSWSGCAPVCRHCLGSVSPASGRAVSNLLLEASLSPSSGWQQGSAFSFPSTRSLGRCHAWAHCLQSTAAQMSLYKYLPQVAHHPGPMVHSICKASQGCSPAHLPGTPVRDVALHAQPFASSHLELQNRPEGLVW